MSPKKNIKEALADSFKSLMLEYPFEKITIKMITDRTGVIRPTFYNHFVDKYEVLEWVCYKDIFEGLKLLVDNDMLTEAIKLLFTKIEHHQAFYLKAVRIQGQNAFQDIFHKQIAKIIEHAFERHHESDITYKRKTVHNKVFTPHAIASYYAHGLTYIIETWLLKGLPINAEEMTKAYYILATQTMEDMMEKGIWKF